MSKMLRLELVGLTLLACTQILTEHQDVRETLSRYNYYPRHQEPERVTREVKVKQGLLRGSVVRPRTNHNFQLVDVYLGVPYAEPPVRSFRFAPPRSPEPWRGIRQSLEFAPVCPQVLPNLRNEVKPGRYEYLERHLPYLKNQSEDCLYLNIYAPHQPEGQKFVKKYPVMFFIHGESYEWNSGNPYDGTILASYGNVVFVTFNFRLGILGFLRPGTRDDTASNFGLLDQIAALLWLRENIAEFGGDPDSVTLVGHGTGAIFANLLLISPVANSKGLFKRAILMSGSAMSSNAIGKAPLQITKQVAHALNCPTTTDSDLSQCLRLQKLDALLNVTIHKPKYVPAFAPLVDNAVIPDKPFNLMQNTQMFGSFDLMYGVTESEKFHLLSPLALLHGMSDSQRDEILRDHAKATHELEPDLILSKVLEQYGEFSSRFSNEYATKNRDMVLEALSDSGTVAPLITTADLHSRANPKSYMYVFTHPKAMQDYSGQQRQRTIHGEELPYVLGVPFDRREYDLRYNIGEILFSEAMMNWWCSFAYSGNPNVAKRFPYLTDGFKEWGQYDVDWPEYDRQNQTYFNLTIPPNVNSHYRSAEMQFWNEDLPNMLRHTDKDIPLPSRPKGPRPEILDIADGIGKYANGSSNKNYEIYRAGFTTRSPSSVTRGNINDDSLFSIFPTTYRGTSIAAPTPEPSHTKNSHVITMLIGFGIVFLLINLTAFLYMYYKRHAIRKKDKAPKRRASQKEESSKRPKMDKQDNHYGELGYKSDSKPDLNDVIKSDKAYDNNSNFGRKSKLSRQNSSSTIDTHVKVREWIQQEIVHRCSPRFLRKTRETLAKEHQEKLTKQQEEEEYKLEQEILKEKQEEPIYDESPTIVVRPGKKSKLPKVSVAIDATPATRTDSILNQVPIELTKQEPSNEQFERAFDYRDFNLYQTSPQVVVIEHHHSRSDPLPMESVQKSAKPNYSTPRIYEYDSGSASSLYAKINPKLKSRLPRLGTNHEDFVTDEATPGTEDRPALEDTYAKTGSKLTTFGAVNPPCDVNVTCREPTVERECVSPEEALRTIKRRNYPKVLPDIEKRRSLPVPTSLFIPKNQANSLRGYGKPAYQISPTGQQQQPPVPPPRIFGASKSLDFAEENENQCEEEPITTNLHVGPLTKRQEPSTRNNSDPSMLDSLEAGMTTNVQSGGSVDAIYTNPKCPVHGTAHAFSSNSQSMDKDIGKPCAHLQTTIGNPNWYKAAPTENKTQPLMWLARSEPRIVITPREPEKQQLLSASGGIAANWDKPVEAKIVIAPRIGNLSDRIGPRNPSSPLRSNETIDRDEVEMMARIDQAMAELPIVDSLEQNLPSSEAEAGILASNGSINTEKKDGRATMASRDQRGCTGSLKQPKIIIKPTTSFHKSRDQRNIPKVSAIPSPERQNCQTVERERPTALEQKESSRYNTGERPPLREKPKVTRIPSFSTTKRKEDSGLVIEKSTTTTSTSVTSSTSSSTTTATATSTSSNSSYAEKTEIVQRVEAVIPTKISPHTAETAAKSGIPTLLRRDQEKSSSAESFATSNSNSNNSGSTGTVKRKPSGKK